MDIDAEHRPLVSTTITLLQPTEHPVICCVSSPTPDKSVDGGSSDGTRNIVVAVGRTDSDYHFALAVLRTLTPPCIFGTGL
jgi:hypothetical protein